jgi:hypothetical protein
MIDLDLFLVTIFLLLHLLCLESTHQFLMSDATSDGLVRSLHECLELQKFSSMFWPKANCLSLSSGLLCYPHLLLGQISVILLLRHILLQRRNSIHNLQYHIVSNELLLRIYVSQTPSCIFSGQTNYDTPIHQLLPSRQ